MKKNGWKSVLLVLLIGLLLCNIEILFAAATAVEAAREDSAENITLMAYPGRQYRRGDSGEMVREIQKMLNRVAQDYSEIPSVEADGDFGGKTEAAVIAFQERFGLKADGIVGPETWDKLEQIYEELTAPKETEPGDATDPGTHKTLRKGDKGDEVTTLQEKLNRVAEYYPAIPSLTVDGDFGGNTERAVKKFQSQFGLQADGVVGKATWSKLDQVCAELDSLNTADEHFIAQPERLEQFSFPEDWSTEALKFAVGNGILNGRDNGLAQNENTTRAETAAILVRLLGAQELSTELDGYTDVSVEAWYYEELSAAVAIGLVKGTSDTTLSPDEPITREQVCTLLSRAFGLYPEDEDSCDRFADSDQISGYARSAVSAMTEQGYLNGYEDGTVKPRANITRAELSKLIYELVTHICDEPGQLPKSGRVLYRGSEAVPDGYTLYGDLTVGCGDGGSLILNNVTVTGELTIRSAPNGLVSLYGCHVGSLSVPASVELYGDETVSLLSTSGAGSSLDISAQEVRVYEDCVLAGSVGHLRLPADGIHAEVNGTVDQCRIDGNNVIVDGGGTIGKVEVYGKDNQISCQYTELNDINKMDAYKDALKIVETVEDWYSFRAREPYSPETMEGFVDQMGYSSSTGYLLWVSTKTLTVNVFAGSEGDWELVKSMPCALGKPSTPTIKGVFSVYEKVNTWYFGDYNCRWVTKFEGGYAFHSRTWKPDYSEYLDDSMSSLVSEGCVRMYDEDCYYIYKNIPVNTTVVVY